MWIVLLKNYLNGNLMFSRQVIRYSSIQKQSRISLLLTLKKGISKYDVYIVFEERKVTGTNGVFMSDSVLACRSISVICQAIFDYHLGHMCEKRANASSLTLKNTAGFLQVYLLYNYSTQVCYTYL